MSWGPRPQPCAACGGGTVSRDLLPGDRSNYCPKCGVWTASSDGLEPQRLQRYVDIAGPIALRLARENLRRGELPSHAHPVSEIPELVPETPRRCQVIPAPGGLVAAGVHGRR